MLWIFVFCWPKLPTAPGHHLLDYKTFEGGGVHTPIVKDKQIDMDCLVF